VTDDRLERSLFDLLGGRDPGPPPERLRRAVAAVPALPARRDRFARLAGLSRLAAAAMLVVAVGIVLQGRPGPTPPAPGVKPAGTSPAPLEPGTGLVTPAAPVVPVMIVFQVIPAAAILVGWRLRSRIGRRAVVLLVPALMVGYGSLAFTDVLGFRGGASQVQPARTEDDGDGVPLLVMLVEPGDLFRIALTVTNVSAVPVTLRGLDPDATGMFVGLGLLRDPQVFDPEAAVAFQPVELPPGGQVDVVALLDAGPCATDPGPEVGGIILEQVPLVSSTFGWERTTWVELPFRVKVPRTMNCAEP